MVPNAFCTPCLSEQYKEPKHSWIYLTICCDKDILITGFSLPAVAERKHPLKISIYNTESGDCLFREKATIEELGKRRLRQNSTEKTVLFAFFLHSPLHYGSVPLTALPQADNDEVWEANN